MVRGEVEGDVFEGGSKGGIETLAKVPNLRKVALPKEVIIMPGFDRTGPRGQGPRTGGGRGFCPPGEGAYAYGEPVVYGVGRGGIPRGGGRGFAFGGGRRHGGRGFGRRWAASPPQPVPQPVYMTMEEELSMLREQSQWMQDQLNQINQRITELTTDQKQGQE